MIHTYTKNKQTYKHNCIISTLDSLYSKLSSKKQNKMPKLRTQPAKFSFFSNGRSRSARSFFFLGVSFRSAESCFSVAGHDEWAIVVSESRFLTFENKVSVKPNHKNTTGFSEYFRGFFVATVSQKDRDENSVK